MEILTDNYCVKSKNKYTSQHIQKKYKNKHRRSKCISEKNEKKHTRRCEKIVIRKDSNNKNNRKGLVVFNKKFVKNINHKDCLVVADNSFSQDIINKFFETLTFNSTNKIKYPTLWKFAQSKLIDSSFWETHLLLKLSNWTKFISKYYNGELTRNKCFKDYDTSLDKEKDNKEWFFEDTIEYLTEEEEEEKDDKIEHQEDDKDDTVKYHTKNEGILMDKSIKMSDIFKHADKFDWEKGKIVKNYWREFRDAWNILRYYCVRNEIEKIPGDKYNQDIPITFSLVLENSQTKKLIEKTIDKYNKFVNQFSCNERKSRKWFELKQCDIIDTSKIKKIILDNIRGKHDDDICTIMIFNVGKIEKKVKKVIEGKRMLDIQFDEFKFMKQNNMLPVMNKLNIQPYRLSHEVLTEFDKQFGKNYNKRKQVLSTLEEIIQLIADKWNHDIVSDKQELYDFLKKKLTKNEDESDSGYSYISNEDDIELFSDKAIKLRHMHDLWYQTVKRIDEQFAFNEEDCLLCYYPLSEETTIELECCKENKFGDTTINTTKGLILHYNCLKEYLASKSIKSNKGNKISMRDVSCINCNKQMTNSKEKRLFTEINYLHVKLTHEIKEQVKLQQQEKKLNYQDPIVFGNTKYAFYLCCDCGDPFYGGLNLCNDIIPEHLANKEERLCPKCVAPKDTCKIHGQFFIKKKCRFCCSPATFYCGGSTSYCEECHKFGQNSYASYSSADNSNNDDHRFPIQQGKRLAWKFDRKYQKTCKNSICPALGIKHPPHGTEMVIGCALCHTQFVNKITARWMKFVNLDYCS